MLKELSLIILTTATGCCLVSTQAQAASRFETHLQTSKSPRELQLIRGSWKWCLISALLAALDADADAGAGTFPHRCFVCCRCRLISWRPVRAMSDTLSASWPLSLRSSRILERLRSLAPPEEPGRDPKVGTGLAALASGSTCLSI